MTGCTEEMELCCQCVQSYDWLHAGNGSVLTSDTIFICHCIFSSGQVNDKWNVTSRKKLFLNFIFYILS